MEVEYHAGDKSVMVMLGADTRFLVRESHPCGFRLARQYIRDSRLDDLRFFIEYGHRKNFGEYEIESTPALFFNVYRDGEIAFTTTERHYDEILGLVFFQEYPDEWEAFKNRGPINPAQEFESIHRNISSFDVNIIEILRIINSQNIWLEGDFMIYPDGHIKVLSSDCPECGETDNNKKNNYNYNSNTMICKQCEHEFPEKQVVFHIVGKKHEYEVDAKNNVVKVLKNGNKHFICIGRRGQNKIDGFNEKEECIASKIVFLLNDDKTKDGVFLSQVNRKR